VDKIYKEFELARVQNEVHMKEKEEKAREEERREAARKEAILTENLRAEQVKAEAARDETARAELARVEANCEAKIARAKADEAEARAQATELGNKKEGAGDNVDDFIEGTDMDAPEKIALFPVRFAVASAVAAAKGVAAFGRLFKNK